MRTPIPFDKLVFSELISVAREVPILRTLAPQVKIPMPDVPTSTPKINSGVKSGITTNQILVGILIGAVLCGVAYYKRRQEELERSSYF